MKKVVISLGGSLLYPDHGLDVSFLKEFNILIRDFVSRGYIFLLVAGGGRLARTYRDAGAAVISGMTNEDLDWLGIHATRLNGHLLRTIFVDIAHPRMIENYYHRLENWTEPVVIGAGWKPGWSTDYCAVELAHQYTADLVINLSNIHYVYDKDPRIHHDAQKFESLTWTQLETIVGHTWTPGLNAPFDPVATRLAKKHNLTVIVANGARLANLRSILEGSTFVGTRIHP